MTYKQEKQEIILARQGSWDTEGLDVEYTLGGAVDSIDLDFWHLSCRKRKYGSIHLQSYISAEEPYRYALYKAEGLSNLFHMLVGILTYEEAAPGACDDSKLHIREFLSDGHHSGMDSYQLMRHEEGYSLSLTNGWGVACLNFSTTSKEIESSLKKARLIYDTISQVIAVLEERRATRALEQVEGK